MSDWKTFNSTSQAEIRRLQARMRGGGRLTEKMLRETLLEARSNVPRRVGDNEAVFTCSTAFDRQPFKWDTNCFYRRLGLTPDCERIEIARAFSEIDPKHPRFLWFATAARVLLKKDSRARYDRTPLGSFWMDDPALTDRILEHVLDNDGKLSHADDEWGVYADPDVTDDEAFSIDPRWRIELVSRVEHWKKFLRSPFTFTVALGACRRRDGTRWEQIGLIPVFFVPIDSPMVIEYVERAAQALVQSARPIRASDLPGGGNLTQTNPD